ncbi:MAG: hypothetical protein MUF13_07840 [Akkermansiaceae bacterium]|jgi:hypothetical protein|nr:hypothetical protein [Akkermansiaceae bacterium]
MKITSTILLTAGAVIALSSCQTQEQILKNQTAAQAWLDGQSSSARIDISGNWFAETWGKANLKQSGRHISGTIDTYEVKGVVSGNKAYLTTWDAGKCYYAIVLSQSSKNVLTGSYTDGPTYLESPKEQRAIELRRSY